MHQCYNFSELIAILLRGRRLDWLDGEFFNTIGATSPLARVPTEVAKPPF